MDKAYYVPVYCELNVCMTEWEKKSIKNRRQQKKKEEQIKEEMEKKRKSFLSNNDFLFLEKNTQKNLQQMCK